MKLADMKAVLCPWRSGNASRALHGIRAVGGKHCGKRHVEQGSDRLDGAIRMQPK